ncbi:bifunctional protein Rib2p [Monosporozyma unispora]|nr:DRAP deaminase [Kazachstania unispora]
MFRPSNIANRVTNIITKVTKRQMSESSNFDTRLSEEIEQAKKVQEIKHKRRKVTDKQLRDSNGFKVRINNSLSGKNKQNEPDYEVKIENNLRKIEPYYFTYKTFCKLRWRDKNLLDVFTSEFRDRSKEYYKEAIENGSVYLDDEPATLDSVIRNGQLITHKLHRHEPPVTAIPVKIVHQDDNILVIDKPSGVPVHPTGRYRFNSVTKMLEKELGFTVHPCNRLDKQTSGLMFLAKTPKGADEMGDQLKAREVSKQYIARVVGEFPIEEITIEKSLKTLEPRVALNVVCKEDDADGKHAKTVFKRISYDGKTSIITCKPLTGRQHQIRVHLQYLGFPIANDPIYSNPHIWGPTLGKNGEADYDKVIKDLYEVGRSKPAQSWFFPDAQGESLKEEKCPVCKTDLYTDPDPNDLILWLHAYKYESNVEDETTGKKKWSYRTEFPDWALGPHRKYMEMAIKEADKCGPTKTAFSVGAVLVNGTEILEVGYSRELPGNTHAEQCALEKYFTKTGKRAVPPGTIIYTTMEPCSFRLSGNEPCVQRIMSLNGNIQTVFVGVLEPDTFVKNNTSLSLLEDVHINYIQIPGYEEQCTLISFKGHEEDMKK